MVTFGHIRVELPEHGFVDLPLAGVGRRSLASLVDLALSIALGIVTLAGVALSLGADRAVATPTVLALGLSFPTALPMAFELIGQGRSPGKAWLGLRVVAADGHRASHGQIALRNVLRLVDFLPAGYGVGLMVVVGTRTAQRLGDLVANTVVITESPDALPGMAASRAHLAAVPKPLVQALESLAAHRETLPPVLFEERRRILLLRFRELRPDWRALTEHELWRELVDE